MSDIKVCPYCAEEIKAAAKICRYCKSNVEEPTSEVDDNVIKQTSKIPCPRCGYGNKADAKNCFKCAVNLKAARENNQNLGTNILSIVVVIIVFSLLFAFCSRENRDSKTKDSPSLAYVYCKNFVENELRAPSTADFPTYNDAFVDTIGNGRYDVFAYVDAENGFGALVRTDFSCKVQFSSDKVELLSLRFSE